MSLAVDLKEKEADVREYFSRQGLTPRLLFIEPFENALPRCLEEHLDAVVEHDHVSGVIISTEPCAHRVYAEWAMKHRLNVLMDKPITARKHAASDVAEAEGILLDYQHLLTAYREAQRDRRTVFSINVQRRYHPGFRKVIELLEEIAFETGCPVTSIQSMHCDGQWRLPSEIVTQNYHPYNQGYGKISHSGYHIIDIATCFYKTSRLTGKVADSGEVFSSFVQPRGFIWQMNEGDYSRYFGDAYADAQLYSDRELRCLYEGYGELDAFSIVRLLEQGQNICNISINLLHNGFARRTWLRPGSDLYKGNGRVKHETHIIQQGPFQSIQVHSYQSSDQHDVGVCSDEHEVGGNDHFDIYVFRNCGMTGDPRPLEIIRLSELSPRHPGSGPRLTSEESKHEVVEEFLRFMTGTLAHAELRSDLEDHYLPVAIMSALYISHVRQVQGSHPIAAIPGGFYA